MVAITVKVSGIDALRSTLAALPGDLRQKVLRPALNKTADKAKAEIARQLPQVFAVKSSDVRSSVSLSPSRGGNLRAEVNVFGSAKRRGRSLNLVHFLAVFNQQKTRGSKVKAKDARQLQAQLGFVIKRGGGLKNIKGAFLANNGRTIFRRTGKARLPIEPLQVIGFSQMFTSRRISESVLKKINADLPVEVERAIAMLKARGLF